MQRALRGGTRRGQAWLPDQAGERAPEGVLAVVSPERLKRDAALRHAPPRRTTMPQYLSPGVYVEEVDSGSRPIEGVGTAVAAFVGLADARPVQHPDPDQQLDAVRVHVRRVRARHLPGARRLRLLHERRRQLLRRPDRRRRQRLHRRSRRDRGRRPAGRIGQPAAGRRGRREPAPGRARDRGRPRGRRGADRRHVQAGREARRPGRRGVRPADHQPRQAERRDDRQRRVQDDQDRGRRFRRDREAGRRHRRPRAARAAGRRPVAVADRRRLRRQRRRAHRLRRARGRRRGHDGGRPRPDERLPAGRDRPGDRAGRPARR